MKYSARQFPTTPRLPIPHQLASTSLNCEMAKSALKPRQTNNTWDHTKPWQTNNYSKCPAHLRKIRNQFLPDDKGTCDSSNLPSGTLCCSRLSIHTASMPGARATGNHKIPVIHKVSRAVLVLTARCCHRIRHDAGASLGWLKASQLSLAALMSCR